MTESLGKVCGGTHGCGQWKPLTDFQRKGSGKKGERRAAFCRECSKKVSKACYNRNRVRVSFSQSIGFARVKDSLRGMLFDLDTPEYKANLWDRWRIGICEVSGVPLSYRDGSPFAATLGRVDHSRGHAFDNVQVECHAANIAFGAWGREAVLPVLVGIVSRAGYIVIPGPGIANTLLTSVSAAPVSG